MKVINWLSYKPTLVEIQQIKPTGSVIHLRTFLQILVRNTIGSFPWNERGDLVELFNPAVTYAPNEWIAIPKIDKQALRHDTWRLARVKSVELGENTKQGKFQVITLVEDGKETLFAAGIPEAEPFTINFPPTEEEDIAWLVSDIVDTYFGALKSAVAKAIDEMEIPAIINGEQLLFGKGISGLNDLSKIIKLSPEKPWIETKEILAIFIEKGELKDISEEMALFAIEEAMNKSNYHCLGRGKWTDTENLAMLDRAVSHRMRVPVKQSKVAKRLGYDDGLPAYDEIELTDLGVKALKEFGVEVPEEITHKPWVPPTGKEIPMATLNYLYMIEEYFPITETMVGAFNPEEDPSVVSIQIVEGEPFEFLVNCSKGEIKVIDRDREAARRHFLKLGIPAGTNLWLEYAGDHRYRIKPRFLVQKQKVYCKQAFFENGILTFEYSEIEMLYEGNQHVFKAEMRFEDIEALFREADLYGGSIFDAIYEVMPQLAEKSPDRKVHQTDVFNAVFFKHRMCSPYTVITELYSRPCFVHQGQGYFTFEPDKGIRRKGRKSIRRPVGTGKKPMSAAILEHLFEDIDETTLAEKIDEYFDGSCFAGGPKYGIINRAVTLYLRKAAHEKIRGLLSKENIGKLSLDTFNKEIWEFGDPSQVEIFAGGWVEGGNFTAEPGELEKIIQNQEWNLRGNLTWGTATGVVAAMLNMPEVEKEEMVRKTLNTLLYGNGSIEKRIQYVISLPNGFGMNVTTGILGAMFPEEFILYNEVSIAALHILGVNWVKDWKKDIEAYLAYCDFAIKIRDQYEFESLTDVDYFMYTITKETKSEEEPKRIKPPELKIDIGSYILSQISQSNIGWVVVHQRKLKGYEDLWAKYFAYMQDHPDASDDKAEAATGIHWRGTMHARYLGFITDYREITKIGKKFTKYPAQREQILHQQLQKWYYWVNGLYRSEDPGYDVFPYFAILKILLGFKENLFSVTWDEFNFFVISTKEYKDCNERIELIREYRKDTKKWKNKLLNTFKNTYVGRIGHMLELSPLFELSDIDIRINLNGVKQAQSIIMEYEQREKQGKIPHFVNNSEEYLKMLWSDKSIFEY